MRVRPPSPWAIVIMGLLGTGLAMVLIVGYVDRVDREAERRNVERQQQICGIIALIDDRNGEQPPVADPTAMEFRRELHAYRVGLGCP